MHPFSLPVRESTLPGESLTSFVRRHAVAMGYETMGRLLSLVDEVKLPPHLDHLGRGPPLIMLSDLLGRPPNILAAMTAHRFADALVLPSRDAQPASQCDSKTLLRFFDPVHLRVCPACLRESVPYERLIWSFRPLPICIKHGVPLIDSCPACCRYARPSRLDLQTCGCGFRLTETISTTIAASALSSATIIQTCLGGARFSSFDLPPPAGFAWLDRLRSAIVRAPSWVQRTRDMMKLPSQLCDESVAWLAAAELMSIGPDRLAEFLDVYQQIAKHRSTSTGVSRAFGLLLREAEQLEGQGYQGPADAMRQYLLGRYTHGHLSGKTTLFRQPKHRRQLRDRDWISQTDAARQIGTRVPVVARLVQQKVLIGRVHAAGEKSRTIGLVSRTSVVALQRKLESGLTVSQAAKRLGVDRHRVMELIHAGVLDGVVRIAHGWRIPAASVDSLLATVHQLPPIPAGLHDWVPLREATRQFGACHFTLTCVVGLLLERKLPARRDPTDSTLRGVYLRISDVRGFAEESLTKSSVSDGWPLNRLAKAIFPKQPLKEIVLQKWIRAGLLHGERRVKQWFIANDEVVRFRTTYCLAQEACRILEITRSTLSRWENAGRVAPAYGKRTHRAAGASLFRRDDISRLLANAAA